MCVCVRPLFCCSVLVCTEEGEEHFLPALEYQCPLIRLSVFYVNLVVVLAVE